MATPKCATCAALPQAPLDGGTPNGVLAIRARIFGNQATSACLNRVVYVGSRYCKARTALQPRRATARTAEENSDSTFWRYGSAPCVAIISSNAAAHWYDGLSLPNRAATSGPG